jgi:osmotically-inducible protein OsmY
MTQTRHRTDHELRTAVVEELDWTPSIDATRIGVAVNDGAVTLSGEVDSYPEKRLAEKAAFRVRGVSAVAEEIMVRSLLGGMNDTDIAREAGEALERAVDVPREVVKASVHDHIITLSGAVPWQFQRYAATRAVRYLRGVDAVRNQITIDPEHAASDIKKSINSALVRNAQLDSNTITVTISDDGAVTLTGTVQSAAERRQAEHTAWSAPGVSSVTNSLIVRS